jgi:hypothetical protein
MEYRGDQLPVLRTYGLPSREEALHVRVVDTTTRLEARRRDPAAAPLELQPVPHGHMAFRPTRCAIPGSILGRWHPRQGMAKTSVPIHRQVPRMPWPPGWRIQRSPTPQRPANCDPRVASGGAPFANGSTTGGSQTNPARLPSTRRATTRAWSAYHREELERLIAQNRAA